MNTGHPKHRLIIIIQMEQKLFEKKKKKGLFLILKVRLIRYFSVSILFILCMPYATVGSSNCLKCIFLLHISCHDMGVCIVET